MPELYSENSFIDHRDSIVHMMMRRTINGEYAEERMDFNIAGLSAAQTILGHELVDRSTIADIGSSSGIMIAEAALAVGTKARIVCVEPHPEAAELHRILDEKYKQRIHFVQGAGEALPLHDNSVQAASLHNVIFRGDAERMLSEVKRVVMPGGVVVVSSNAKGHAAQRHRFERQVAEVVSNMTGTVFRIPPPPAEGHYLEDLPDLFARVGGLEMNDEHYVSQDTEAQITRGERLDSYLQTIEYAYINTGLHSRYNGLWRMVVNFWVRQEIETIIDEVDQAFKQQGVAKEPFFEDTVRRGMYVLINNKTS